MDTTRATQTRDLTVNSSLRSFIDEEVLPGTGVHPQDFWLGLSELVTDMAPRNRELLATRESLQTKIDAWHRSNPGGHETEDYQKFLVDIGYLVDEPTPEPIQPGPMDEEISAVAGPQLVVPVTNERYVVNAANARWGSLYDALYGTDVLGSSPPAGPFDSSRGKEVVQWAKAFLDEAFPLTAASHAEVTAYKVDGSGLVAVKEDGSSSALIDAKLFVGFLGTTDRPESILLRHHGLGVELVIDRTHPVGKVDAAGIRDIGIEAAVSVIIDFEDSVATVDTDDKVEAYRNWLGLMRGDLEANVEKAGRRFVRVMSPDREFRRPAGGSYSLPGRSLLLVRNVGLLMTTDAVRDADGNPIPEGFLDGLVTVACALHDLRGLGRLRNSRANSVYVVKPKLHGPDEVAFTVEMFSRIEHILGLPPNTVKLGVMDEERRTSANLAACIKAAGSRLAFINTGFLDRTGDEIHTSMRAGCVVRKAEMKGQEWMKAYEDQNVDLGLAFGLQGNAQIGKGMWAAPDLMAAMLREKINHPLAGASCAWVPSPTAATLHATHYHRVDVRARQAELAGKRRSNLEALLRVPVASQSALTDEERLAELESNAQGILGYVVRWVDQGIGCSKVLDINGVGLMEDRATCRISSQHIANWLHHGVTSEDEVLEVMRRMAAVVDEQNKTDPLYIRMTPECRGPAFRAAVALVLEGASQPSGYTEPILHRHRLEVKAGNG